MTAAFTKLMGVTALIAASCWSTSAKAIDFILPGMEAKAASGAGQTVSRGGSAVFFNPANVILSQGVQPEADLSLVNVTYSYQNIDAATYEPAVLGVTSPATSAGLAWRINSSSAIGFEVLPLGLGTPQNYYGAPVEIVADTFQAMDVTRKEVVARLGFGGAYRFMRKFTVGGSFIFTTERSSVLLKNAGTDRTAIEASYAGRSLQPVIGLRVDLGSGLIVAGSYRTSVTRPYTGTLAINSASQGSPDEFQRGDFSGKAFDPALFGLGLEWRYQAFGVFADFNHKFWARGRGVSKSGFGAEAGAVDLVDANDIVLGGKYWLGVDHMIQVAIGHNGANIGNGDVKNPETNSRSTNGVQLGQTEAIPRSTLSGGYGLKLAPGKQVQAALMVVNGMREVPAGYSQAGSYKLQAFIVSVGATVAL